MSKQRYYGIYAQFLENFVKFKQNIGYQGNYTAVWSTLFDKFTIQRKETVIGITKELASQWGQKRANESERTMYARVSFINQFSAFLTDSGYPSQQIPMPKHYRRPYLPYIFTREEMYSIFAVCDKFPLNTNMRSTVVVLPALIRFLYGTGVRINEALALKAKDVNLEENTCIIRDSKNGKERMIAISESLSEVCQQYRKTVNHVSGISDYFFIRRNGEKCTCFVVYQWFRKALYKAGIPHSGKGHGPRLHDIRHTFSVHALAKMSESGLDLYYSLPILSTFLGHQSLEATDKYVRLTSNMYPKLIHDTNNICSYIFPVVEINETD
ncbi:MAG: tyrosine-type recombinase/integrase [Bacteroidales bacterium]|nr:tyrosine-type recombinase/integrase [Bacteroidales bacterium]